ncbi:uncharacterized protein Z518_03438 [Rhinocladiella mackenziei CBS 650.93]|uniref:PH-response regulator protein palH/RIM21 n=1 Tax=Rhinocladiella mackenziei CBS 650.93 TaxID=1442369 RepID=A0A0D2IZC7_9EURO|nr:uncharacterized protein Z518_03438 [Rhinocladiella mackenziei CBS 650.93]KIX08781.1 hypothetical protein Z518_03438 [Rhinocladiella mackenziei CBS 650.93]
MSNDAYITARQLWGQLSTTTTGHTASEAWCTPLILPSGGVIVFENDQTSTLQAQVTFKLPCENSNPIISPDTTGNSTVIGFQDPFYASISPQIFALATATVISYVLVILIFITPRTFFVGGPGGGAGFLGRRGRIPGSYASSSIVGVGRRPLLQKIATVTVAISLTIATADTFAVAEDQYNQGYMDSSLLVDNVVGSLEIRIIRVISDTFLWLAQVQTLIRLFPRHKEKVTIKWLGFVMVSLDTIFSILDSFVSGNPRTRPRSFQDAIPALNYLFELSISLIYASCVVYYCLSKRRFAFWHPKMKNICLVALLSLVSVVIPVVFFVLDISQPNLAGWGEYIRWVGAAAASVVVWEWVERIESLERDERKDGILGREIFDGDEMLNMTPSEDASWHGRDSTSGQGGDGRKNVGDGVVSHYKRLRLRLPLRKRRRAAPPDGISTGADAMNTTGPRMAPNSQLPIPEPVMTPPSRSDTGSAASTVYAIRYHNLTSPSPNLHQEARLPQERNTLVEVPKVMTDRSGSESSASATDKEIVLETNPQKARTTAGFIGRHMWRAVPHPFKRRKAEPPAEVADAQIANGWRRSPIDRTLNLRDRFGAFASAQRERFASRGTVSAAVLPVTVIPAPKNNDRTWSPDDVRDGAASDGAIAMNTVAASRPLHERSGAPTGSGDLAQVMVIPAPTPGRTWSPNDADDMSTSGPPQTPSSSDERSDSAARPDSSPASGDVLASHNIYIPRGSLTISESEPRVSRVADAAHPTSPRSASYVPPPEIVPIPETTADDVSVESDDAGGQAIGNTSSIPARGTEEPSDVDVSTPAETEAVSTVSSESSPTIVANPSPQEQQRGRMSSDTSASEDGRDTGGTRAS